jgi:Rhodopirellula transposase DDE domain
LQWSHTLGRHAARGSGRSAAAGGSARATSPNVAHAPGLYPSDSAIGAGSLARPRVECGPVARALDEGRGTQSPGRAAAQRSASQTAKEDGGDRRPCRQDRTKDHQAAAAQGGKWLSIDCKAPVHIGEVSRGGRTRGDHAACDHDLGLQAKAMPCGIVEEESGQRSITFGSAYKTSDGSVDALAAWGAAWDTNAQGAMARLQSNIDTGPESRGKRTQFFQRMVGLCDAIGKPIQLRYALPTPARILPVSGAGASWHCPGTGPSSSIGRR